jgi:hypothetical protein
MIIAIDDNTILQVKSQRRGHTALQIGILNGLSHRLVEFMHKLLESRLGRGLLLKCARGPARTSTDEKASVQRPIPFGPEHPSFRSNHARSRACRRRFGNSDFEVSAALLFFSLDFCAAQSVCGALKRGTGRHAPRSHTHRDPHFSAGGDRHAAEGIRNSYAGDSAKVISTPLSLAWGQGRHGALRSGSA